MDILNLRGLIHGLQRGATITITGFDRRGGAKQWEVAYGVKGANSKVKLGRFITDILQGPEAAAGLGPPATYLEILATN